MTRALRGVLALVLCWLIAAAPAAAQMTLLLGAGPGAASGGGGGGGGTPALFVASDGQHTAGASGSMALPTSGGSGRTAAAGDICLVLLSEGIGGTGAVSSPAGGGTAWVSKVHTAIGSSWWSVWSRVLTSGDIGQGSSAIAWSGGDGNGAISATCWRGPTTVTLISASVITNSAGSATLVVPSWTPNAASAGTAILYDVQSNDGVADFPSTPSGYTSRLAVAPWIDDLNVLDQLTSPTGASVTLTSHSTANKGAWPLEFTP